MPVLFNIEYDGHPVLKAIALNRRKTHFLRHLLPVPVSESKVLFGAHSDPDMQRALQQRLNKGVVPWRDFRPGGIAVASWMPARHPVMDFEDAALAVPFMRNRIDDQHVIAGAGRIRYDLYIALRRNGCGQIQHIEIEYIRI